MKNNFEKLKRTVEKIDDISLKEKFNIWEKSISNTPEFSEIQKINQYINTDLRSRFKALEYEEENKKDKVKEKLQAEIQALENKKDKLMDKIHQNDVTLKNMRKIIIDEVNKRIKTKNIKVTKKIATQHIFDRATSLSNSISLETNLWDFQQCMEAFDNMRKVYTDDTLLFSQFWEEKTNKYKEEMSKLDNGEKIDKIIKTIPRALFAKANEYFGDCNWNAHPKANERLTEMIEFMPMIIEQWRENLKKEIAEMRATYQNS